MHLDLEPQELLKFLEQDKQQCLQAIQDKILTLTNVEGQLGNRFDIANSHMRNAMDEERHFYKEASWEASMMDIQKALFKTADALFAAAGILAIVPALTRLLAQGVGMTVLRRSVPGWLIKQQSGTYALNVLALEKKLTTDFAKSWLSKLIIGGGAVAVAFQVFGDWEQSLGPEERPHRITREPEFKLVEYADMAMRSVRDGKERAWQSLKDSAAKQRVSLDKLPPKEYYAYYSLIRKAWYGVSEGILFSLRACIKDIECLEQLRSLREKKP